MDAAEVQMERLRWRHHLAVALSAGAVGVGSLSRAAERNTDSRAHHSEPLATIHVLYLLGEEVEKPEHNAAARLSSRGGHLRRSAAGAFELATAVERSLAKRSPDVYSSA
jgi:hypothetical protein